MFGLVWHCRAPGVLCLSFPPSANAPGLHRALQTKILTNTVSSIRIFPLFHPIHKGSQFSFMRAKRDVGIVLRDAFPSVAPQRSPREPWNTKHMDAAANNTKQQSFHCFLWSFIIHPMIFK